MEQGPPSRSLPQWGRKLGDVPAVPRVMSVSGHAGSEPPPLASTVLTTEESEF